MKSSLIQVVVFWVVAPCSNVVEYQRFRGLCCLNFTLKMQRPRSSETMVSYHTVSWHKGLRL